MKLSTLYFLIAIIFALSLSGSFYVYNLIPDNASVPSHWNIYGEVDGQMEKGVGLFLLPGLLTFISLILIGIPYIDPLQKNK